MFASAAPNYDVYTLCEDPRVQVVENFFNESEAKHIIQLAENGMERARVSDDKEGSISDARTNSLCWVKHDKSIITSNLADRVAKFIQMPVSHAESFQVIRYGPTQEYRAHFDAYDLSTERGQRCTARGGQRLVTVLGYLNDVEAGGSTAFPHLNINVVPKTGRLLIFDNVYKGTTDIHKQSLHAGTPVVKGIKWAFNLWFHIREFK
ncbi:2OG-Fe(II) oxygenase [Pseudidiomarina aestuarii]|uniref:2OG-Fe(II) oxygenase n=1 Tax=Pseudidiomarina aestuarii TaxID=624146 RepID=A0A7Z6ZUJ5_9GAMM|nr:2OG-Fe(II) oxygenase [Pseudidiomarina aestuarii]RUO41585.1 2OG-Fe(II) oxygenase [Pseudidiomarina aestuarii]